MVQPHPTETSFPVPADSLADETTPPSGAQLPDEPATEADAEWQDARAAWEASAWEAEVPATQQTAASGEASDLAVEPNSDEEAGSAAEAAADPVSAPFVGRWNRLVSFTNWEKGKIISQWREAMIESGADVSDYSDELWASRVGGVTASHVGRLRRVHNAFAESHTTYPDLSWTHFLAALDWDDAPMWLEGAVQSGWSVAAMRRQRWQVLDGDLANQPDSGDSLAPPWDEDFDPRAVASGATGTDADAAANYTQPGQGGGSAKEYGDEPDAIRTGPVGEGPDFGDEDSLNRSGSEFSADSMPIPANADPAQPAVSLVQPFAGLPALPNDLADAVELMKLALLRHKSAGWKEVSPDDIRQYLGAFNLLIEAPNG